MDTSTSLFFLDIYSPKIIVLVSELILPVKIAPEELIVNVPSGATEYVPETVIFEIVPK